MAEDLDDYAQPTGETSEGNCIMCKTPDRPTKIYVFKKKEFPICEQCEKKHLV